MGKEKRKSPIDKVPQDVINREGYALRWFLAIDVEYTQCNPNQ